jgi:hypothetical protein
MPWCLAGRCCTPQARSHSSASPLTCSPGKRASVIVSTAFVLACVEAAAGPSLPFCEKENKLFTACLSSAITHLPLKRFAALTLSTEEVEDGEGQRVTSTRIQSGMDDVDLGRLAVSWALALARRAGFVTFIAFAAALTPDPLLNPP